MPIVPVEQNRVGIAEVSGAKFRAPDMSGGVGDALAAGAKNIAGAVAQYAITQDSIQDNADKLAARNLALTYKASAGKIKTDFDLEQGSNAVNKSAETQGHIDTARDDALNAAANPRQRAYLTPMIAELHPEFQNGVYQHSKKEQFVYSNETYAAEAGTAASDAGANYADPEKQAKAFADSDAAVDRLAHLNGWSAPVTADKKLKLRDGAHTDALTTMLTSDNLDGALSYYGAHKSEMTLDGRNRFLAAVQGPLEKREDSADFAEITSGASGTVGARQSITIPSGTYRLPVTGTITNTYSDHVKRGSAGLDVAAPIGSGIHPIAGGTVIDVHAANDGDSGMYVRVQHSDGHISSYAHMGNISVKKGDAVGGSTVLGTVGMTGHTTGPHVHLRVRDAGGKDVDPQALMGKGSPGGSVVGSTEAPRNWDQGAVMAQIDARKDWTPEKKERMRGYASTRMRQDESLLTDQYQDAAQQATVFMAQQGDKFTSVSQLPASISRNMDPAGLARLDMSLKDEAKRKAETTAKAGEEQRTAKRFTELQWMKRLEPEKFKNLDMTREVGNLAPGQWNSLALEQLDARQKPAVQLDTRPGITQAITWGKKYNGAKIDDDQFPAVYDTMDGILRHRATKGPLTQKDYDEAFGAAMREVPARGFFGGKTTIPLSELTYDQLGDNTREKARSALIRQGVKNPSDTQVLAVARTLYAGEQ